MAISKIKSKKYGFTFQVDLRYEENGIRKRHIKSGFLDKKQAQKYQKMFEAQLEANKIKNSIQMKTFNDVYLEYMKMEGEHKYAHSTIQSYNYLFKKYIKNDFGKTNIKAIDYKNLQNEFNRLSTFLSPQRVKDMKDTYSVVFKYCIRCNYLKENPASFLKLPKGAYLKQTQEAQVISDEDLQKIIDEIQDVNKYDPKGQRGGQFVAKGMAIGLYIGRYTGVRVSEVLALKKSDFDLDRFCLTLQRKLENRGIDGGLIMNPKMKSKSSQATVEIPKHLAQVLKQWFDMNPNELVICLDDGSPLSISRYQVRIKEVSNNLNIHFHYHMLRHTYATELMMNHVNPLVVQRLLRHSSVTTTIETYSHAQSLDQREVMDMLYK